MARVRWMKAVMAAGWLVAALAGGAGGLRAGETAPTGGAGGTAEKAPPPSKIAVIFLDTVLRKSSQLSNIRKVTQDRNARVDELRQTMQRLQNDKINLEKNISLGVGNQPDMQDRWLKVMQQMFKVQTDMRQLQTESQDQLGRMWAALMVDINRAIEQVALRERIDVVINRKDAELAATEQKKLRDELLEAGKTDNPAQKPKNDENLDKVMKQQMLSKLENTFVWSNDSMDITDAVVAQLNQDYKDQKFTNWRDMPSTGEDQNGRGPGGGDGGGGGGGAAIPGTE